MHCTSHRNHGGYPQVGFRRDKKTVDEKGFTLMTLDYLRQLCKEQKGYVTPSLNDTLYLHYKGFNKISSDIAHYSGLKSLWLEHNALSELEHLETLQELRCLYLQENCFSHLHGIGVLAHLTILNVSNNFLEELPEDLASLPQLTNLHVSHNKLRTQAHVAVLARCSALSVLDLHHNALDAEDVLDTLAAMPALAVLTLHANPLVPRVHHLRKQLVLRIPTLRHFEERPVSDHERSAVAAWAVGGAEAEARERARQRQAEHDAHRAGFLRLAALHQHGPHVSAAETPTFPPHLQRFYEDMVAKVESAVPKAEEGADPVDRSTSEDEDDGAGFGMKDMQVSDALDIPKEEEHVSHEAVEAEADAGAERQVPIRSLSTLQLNEPPLPPSPSPARTNTASPRDASTVLEAANPLHPPTAPSAQHPLIQELDDDTQVEEISPREVQPQQNANHPAQKNAW